MITVKKNTVPFFSIIITTFNRAKQTENALNSLLSNSERDWEAIVVDDGSIDNTFNIVKDKIKKDDRIRYIFQNNQGPALAKNTGILASSGSIITFLDSDDEYRKDHLAVRKEIFYFDDTIDMVHGGVDVIGYPYVPDENNRSDLIHINDCIIGGTFFIKTEKIIELNGFPAVDFGEDIHLYEKAKSKNFKIAKTNASTYIYNRKNSESICNRIRKHAERKSEKEKRAF